MKRTILFFLVVMLVAAVLTVAFAPYYTLELDSDWIALLGGIATSLMAGFFKWLGTVFKKDMSGWVAITAAAAAALLVGIINALLSAVPPTYETLGAYVLKILLLLLTSMGVYALKKHTSRKVGEWYKRLTA